MEFIVPEYNLEKLTKKVESIARKGVPAGIVVGEPVDRPDPFRRKVVHHCFRVEVYGDYKINGWRFVATIEHKGQAGNIVRIAAKEFEGKIPEAYRTCGPKCDHCHADRPRKDTYLIYNDETEEFKQVGKACLSQYTRGMSAEVAGAIASMLSFADGMQRLYMDEDEARTFSSHGYAVSGAEARSLAYAYIKKYGYRRDKAKDDLFDMLFTLDRLAIKMRSELEAPSKDELDEIDAFFAAMPDDTDYKRNVKVLWGSEDVESRDMSLLASAAFVFFKAKSEQAQREAETKALSSSEYQGEVGGKVAVVVKDVKTLYSKAPYAYYGATTYVYRIVDTNGNVFVWSTTSSLAEGDEFVATVKAHQEYKGVKQTVVTRGKFTKRAEPEEA